jgi:tetratricopeptide (TPR) repeat protein
MMISTRSVFLWTLFAILSSATAALAGEVTLLRGHLRAGSRAWFEGLVVTIAGTNGPAGVMRSEVGVDGAFEFHSVPFGDYMLRVTGLDGEMFCEQLVSVRSYAGELAVRMPEPEARTAASAPATVSVRQLLHPPDKKALKAFEEASRLSAKGRYQEAAAELEKAIQISPDFADAHANLAAQRLRARRYQDALAETQRAIEIAGPRPLILSNRAYAFFQLDRMAEAEDTARAALRLDSGYLPAHAILGAVLANNPASKNEAILHLQLAAPQYPGARESLERLRAMSVQAGR